MLHDGADGLATRVLGERHHGHDGDAAVHDDTFVPMGAEYDQGSVSKADQEFEQGDSFAEFEPTDGDLRKNCLPSMETV